MRGSAALSTRTLVSAVALLGAAVMGAGITAVLAPSSARVTTAHAAAHPVAVTKPVRVTPGPATARRAAPSVTNVKASFVSASTDNVTVEGIGSISGTPDVLLVNLQVTVQRDTTGAALDGANAVVERLLTSLRGHGVRTDDIQTTGLSLSPNYDYDNGKQTRNGYVAGQSLSAKLRSAERRGATISAAAAVSPDVTITGLSFDLENNAGLLARAQRAAFTMARDEATRYAGMAGRSLGRVMSVNQMTTRPTPPPYMAGGGGFGAAPTAAGGSDVPLSAGSQQVSVSVVVTWALR